MKENLADKIVKEAEKIPEECQEKVLDIVKAMNFTRKVIMKDIDKKQNK